jgi:hypothetical protein
VNLGLLLALFPAASAQSEARQLTVQTCTETSSPSQALGAVLRTRHGSAVLISSDGVVLSNTQSIGQDWSRPIQAWAPSGTPLTLNVVRVDTTTQSVLLKVQGEQTWPCLPLNTAEFSLGEPAYVLGFPDLTAPPSISLGIVSAKRQVAGRPVIQTDASVNPRNTGGALVNQEGQVLGLVSSKVSGVAYEGLAFAVPVDEVLKGLKLSIAPQTDLTDPGLLPQYSPAQAGTNQATLGAEAGVADARSAFQPLRPLVLGAGAGACLGFAGCLTPCVGPACMVPTGALAPAALAFAQKPNIDPAVNAALESTSPDYQLGYEIAYGLETRKRRGLYTGAGAIAGTFVGATVGTLVYIAVIGVTPWDRIEIPNF